MSYRTARKVAKYSGEKQKVSGKYVLDLRKRRKGMWKAAMQELVV